MLSGGLGVIDMVPRVDGRLVAMLAPMSPGREKGGLRTRFVRRGVLRRDKPDGCRNSDGPSSPRKDPERLPASHRIDADEPIPLRFNRNEPRRLGEAARLGGAGIRIGIEACVSAVAGT